LPIGEEINHLTAPEIHQDGAIPLAPPQRELIDSQRRNRFRKRHGHGHDPTQDRGGRSLDA
jgi:hypothetical protein